MNKITRTTQTIDAAGKAPGRLASQISRLLIGKHKASYVPNIDAGDVINVVNAGKMVVTGNKMVSKMYYRHSTHPGGLKTEQLKTVFEKNPGEVLRRAVSRMLPKNRMRDARLKRLTIKN